MKYKNKFQFFSFSHFNEFEFMSYKFHFYKIDRKLSKEPYCFRSSVQSYRVPIYTCKIQLRNERNTVINKQTTQVVAVVNSILLLYPCFSFPCFECNIPLNFPNLTILNNSTTQVVKLANISVSSMKRKKKRNFSKSKF